MKDKINIDFNYYKTFYYVAKCCNFSLAAKELNVSQPAVSYTISELEKALNTQLFIRKGKKIELTRSGELLFDYVDDCFNTLMIAENKILQKEENSQIRIGAQSHIVRCLTPFHKVIEQHKDNNITFYDDTASGLIKKVSQKEIDFAIIGGNYNVSALTKVKITDFHMGFVIRANKLAKTKKTDYKTMKFALPLPSTSIRKELDKKLIQKEISLNVAYEFNSNQMCISLIDHLDCAFYLPIEMIRKEIENGAFMKLDFGVEDIEIPVFIVYNEKYISAQALDIINKLKNCNQ